MNPSQSSRVVIPFYNTSVATNATQTAIIDLNDFNYASVEVIGPVATATNSTQQFAACALRFGDTTAFTSATTAARFTGGTQTSSSVGYVFSTAASTSNPYVVKFDVSRERIGGARYLFAAVTPNASHNTLAIRAELFKGAVAATADTTASRNVANSVRG